MFTNQRTYARCDPSGGRSSVSALPERTPPDREKESSPEARGVSEPEVGASFRVVLLACMIGMLSPSKVRAKIVEAESMANLFLLIICVLRRKNEIQAI